MQTNTNREAGKLFEDIFETQARFNGLLPLKNHLKAMYGRGGKVHVVKSELDFKLINNAGHVAYVDCKSFQEDFFTYSSLDQKQIDRAIQYNEWNVSSGFIVYFQKSNKVVFYSGLVIQRKGRRSRFTEDDGQLLGISEHFDLKKIMFRTKP